MALLDLLGRRWCLRILWELRHDRLTFRELQTAAGNISPTVLNSRLGELRTAGLVDQVPGDGYGLTPMGHELLSHLGPLHRFAESWAARLAAP